MGAGTYYVRVRGVNANGAGAPSNEEVLRVGGVCSRAPLPPTNLTVTVAGSTVVFAWDDVSPAADTPTGYRLQAGVEPMSTLVQFGVSGNVYRVTSVPAGNYYARVSGVNSCGVSGVSNEVSVRVGGPAVPVVVTGVHQWGGAPTDGANFSSLMQGRDGNFYGTTVSGGPLNTRCVANLDGCGTIFKMTPAGAVTILYAFGSNGSSLVYPYARLLQAADGNFWGTTTGQENGTGAASVYKMAPNGSNSFISELGGPSFSTLIQGTDGSIYGTTIDNGPGTCSSRSTQCTPTAGSGTVFKVTSGGTLTTLHVFNGGADGSKPYAGLVLASDGNLYGTTQSGASGFGTVFRIRTDGTFTTLYTFTGGSDEGNPYAALIQGSDGNLYGSAVFGTSYNAGTIFKITTAGAFTLLHTFTGYSVPDGTPRPGIPLDGAFPAAPLVQAADGSFVGVTAGGGALSGGTAFKITSAGGYSQVAVFSGNAEGSSPIWLIRASDGNFYGTGQYGGVVNQGAVFRMTPP